MTNTGGEETRIVARLSHLDLAVVHRQQYGGAEEMLIGVRLSPLGQHLCHPLAVAAPLLPWMLVTQALWSSWLGGLAALAAAPLPFGKDL
jgi:hypothetical protein